MKLLCAAVLSCALLVIPALNSYAQTNAADELVLSRPTTADGIQAEEEFRRGVQAFNRGSFNESILLFEKALSFFPGQPIILEWLGRAYYRSGVEGSALQQWQFALDAGADNLLLRNRIEVVRERRTIRPIEAQGERFVEAAVISPLVDKTRLFSQPLSVVTMDDGTFWAVAYGTNEMLRFDVNGLIVQRTRGPLGGLDRPFDVIRLANGNLLVSEFAADRISLLSSQGNYISSFGTKGRAVGQLLGPQYLAEDNFGTIFVTDFGNARIAAFDASGKGLFYFGEKSDTFPGLLSPSGIACFAERLYVADSLRGALHVFDTSGNFIETLLPEGSLYFAEAVRVWKDSLIISAKNRVVRVDPYTGAQYDLASLGNIPSRITCAVPDINGNLVLADYRGNKLQILTRMSDLAGGMFVQIERVNADNFPNVSVEVRVEDRNRNPVSGLKAANFLVTESDRPVSAMKLAGSAYLNDVCDITVIVDRSPRAASYVSEIRTAIAEIAAAMNGKGTLRLVSAGAVPLLEGSGNPSTGSWTAMNLRSPLSSAWALDMGLRLAVNDLVNAEKKRAVIFLSAGELGSQAFSRYGLNDLAAYMNNNGVLFSTIYLGQGAALDELEYLSQRTGGKSAYIYRREGLSSLVADILAAPNGSYLLTFTSALSTEFGKAYLKVEVETYLMNRSGRDETGYFAPLQ